MGLIYCATFQNGKIYIGQTTRKLNQRINEHIYASEHASNLLFHKAIRKYGKSNINWSILEDNIENDQLNDKENFWVNKLDSFYEHGNGYNMTFGGDNYINRCLFDPKGEEAAEIYEYYKIVGSTVIVAKKYDCGVNTINSLLGKIDPDWKCYGNIGRGHIYKFSEEEALSIYEEFKQIGNIIPLSEKYGVSRSTITDLLKRIDPEYSKFKNLSKFSREEQKEIVQYYEKTKSIQQTAKHYNICWSTARNIIGK